MGGKSWTNPNRGYNSNWWLWYDLFKSERFACLMDGGHRWYDSQPKPGTTCARCLSPIRVSKFYGKDVISKISEIVGLVLFGIVFCFLGIIFVLFYED